MSTASSSIPTPAWPSISLELRDVAIERGGEPVLGGVNLKVSSGDGIQFFGRNGSGKSSLLQAIAGLTPVAEGALEWQVDGQAQGRTPVDRVVFVGHDASVKRALTGRENLGFWAKTYGRSLARAKAALERAGVAQIADMSTGRYSAGQRRRLDLARCLLASRPIWLLDEPTASLDEEGAAIWATTINSHLDEGGLALIASHDRLDIRARSIRVG